MVDGDDQQQGRCSKTSLPDEAVLQRMVMTSCGFLVVRASPQGGESTAVDGDDQLQFPCVRASQQGEIDPCLVRQYCSGW